MKPSDMCQAYLQNNTNYPLEFKQQHGNGWTSQELFLLKLNKSYILIINIFINFSLHTIVKSHHTLTFSNPRVLLKT